LAAVATLIDESGAIDEALDAARAFVERAVARLDIVNDSAVAAQLEGFAQLALNRQF
jgi:geranylgeranyl pyrophosphate synthase